MQGHRGGRGSSLPAVEGLGRSKFRTEVRWNQADSLSRAPIRLREVLIIYMKWDLALILSLALLRWSLGKILLNSIWVLPLLGVSLDEIYGRMALDSGGIFIFKILWSFLREQAASDFKIYLINEVDWGQQWLRIPVIKENSFGSEVTASKGSRFTQIQWQADTGIAVL